MKDHALREAVRHYLHLERIACSCADCQAMLREARAQLAELVKGDS